jgi:hypothetical protein
LGEEEELRAGIEVEVVGGRGVVGGADVSPRSEVEFVESGPAGRTPEAACSGFTEEGGTAGAERALATGHRADRFRASSISRSTSAASTRVARHPSRIAGRRPSAIIAQTVR